MMGGSYRIRPALEVTSAAVVRRLRSCRRRVLGMTAYGWSEARMVVVVEQARARRVGIKLVCHRKPRKGRTIRVCLLLSLESIVIRGGPNITRPLSTPARDMSRLSPLQHPSDESTLNLLHCWLERIPAFLVIPRLNGSRTIPLQTGRRWAVRPAFRLGRDDPSPSILRSSFSSADP